MKLKVSHLLVRLVAGILLLVAFVLFWAARWYVSVYGQLGFDAVLYTLTGGLNGVAGSLVRSYVLRGLAPAVLSAAVVWVLLCWPWPVKRILPLPLPAWLRGVAAGVLAAVLLVSAAVQVELPRWLVGRSQVGLLYEEEYVDPSEASIIFPEEKRNLIYILLESMETTYLPLELGGGQEPHVMPELYELAVENINFSQNEGVGGWSRTSGATWTMGAMVAQSAGIPLSDAVEGNSYGTLSEFLPGVTTLNDVLHENGYYQVLMVGSDAGFAGRDKYYSQHGVDIIYDIDSAWADGIVEAGRYVWWGMEDMYLYEYAKQELLEMAAMDQPFAFTMLTVDTHHIGGYLCEQCGSEFPEQYANVIACASRQLTEFVDWLQQQEFYENTTVVICGDHQSMDADYFARNMTQGYDRCVYNCILNSAVEVDEQHTKNRMITPFDMFPTTLAAMGCDIGGDRLALGVNLFSTLPTLVERYGSYGTMNAELEKISEYYNDVFLHLDEVQAQ